MGSNMGSTMRSKNGVKKSLPGRPASFFGGPLGLLLGLFGSNLEAIHLCLAICEGLIGNLVIHEGKGAQSKRLKREFGFKKFWIPVSISFLLPSESAAGNLYEISLDRKVKLRPFF